MGERKESVIRLEKEAYEIISDNTHIRKEQPEGTCVQFALQLRDHSLLREVRIPEECVCLVFQ
jgi:hypothetical protein